MDDALGRGTLQGPRGFVEQFRRLVGLFLLDGCLQLLDHALDTGQHRTVPGPPFQSLAGGLQGVLMDNRHGMAPL